MNAIIKKLENIKYIQQNIIYHLVARFLLMLRIYVQKSPSNCLSPASIYYLRKCVLLYVCLFVCFFFSLYTVDE